MAIKSEIQTRITADNSDFNSKLGESERLVKGFAKVVAGAFAADKLRAGLTASFNAFRDFDKGLIGIQKTTGLTGDALAALGDEFRGISKSSALPVKNLLATAEAAGQLGISGADNISKFTVTIEKLKVAAESLNNEFAATELARFLNLSGAGVGQVENIASAIAFLGNNFATTEGEILSMATGLSQTTTRFGVSAEEILGFSAALSQAGVQAELARSAFGEAFQKISDAIKNGGKELETLQRVTGKTGDELRKAFDKNAASVLQDYVNGLSRLPGAEVSAALEGLGLNGLRANAVFGALAQNTEVLSNALAGAAEQSAKNTALNAEYEAASKSLAASFQRFKNRANDLAITVGQRLAPAFSAFFERAGNAISVLADIAENSRTLVIVLQGLAALIGIKLVTAISQFSVAVATRLIVSLQTARLQFGLLKLEIAATNGFLKKFFLLLRSTPLGLVAGLATAAAVAFAQFGGAAKSATPSLDGYKKSVDDVATALRKARAESEYTRISYAKTAVEIANSQLRINALVAKGAEVIAKAQRIALDAARERAEKARGIAAQGARNRVAILEKELATTEARAKEFAEIRAQLEKDKQAALDIISKEEQNLAAAPTAPAVPGLPILETETGGATDAAAATDGTGLTAPDLTGGQEKSVKELLQGTPQEREQAFSILAENEARKKEIEQAANLEELALAAATEPEEKTVDELLQGTPEEREQAFAIIEETQAKRLEARENFWSALFGIDEAYRKADTQAEIKAADQKAKTAKQLGDALVGLANTRSKKLQAIGRAAALAQSAYAIGIALAEGTASAAKEEFPENLIAIAATVARVLAIGSQAASIIKGKRADGGIVNAGQPYLVGERGQEVFVPRQSGEIMTTAAIKEALSSGGKSEVVISFDSREAARILSAEIKRGEGLGII